MPGPVQSFFPAVPLQAAPVPTGWSGRGHEHEEVLRRLHAELPPTLGRKLVELLFYGSVLNATMQSFTGINEVRFVTGGFILLAGLVAALMVLLEREPIPISVWMSLLVNLGANVSLCLGLHVWPFIGEGLQNLVHWTCNLMMMCYLVRNEATQRRIVFFLAVLIIAMAAFASSEVSGRKVTRMKLEVAGTFSNPDDLGHNSGILSATLLFWSLRGRRSLRPVLWLLAGLLCIIMLRTATRGSALSYACGLAVLISTIMAGRGTRLAGAALIGVASLAFIFAGYVFLEPLSRIMTRATSIHDVSTQSRIRVYSMETLRDLEETLFFGQGTSAEVSSAGVQAHNSYIFTHMCYGGIAAIPYALWLGILGLRLGRMLLARDYPFDVRMNMLCLFGMCLAAQLLSNRAYMFLACVYGTAVIEKYTAAYSHRRMVQRRAALNWRPAAVLPAAVRPAWSAPARWTGPAPARKGR